MIRFIFAAMLSFIATPALAWGPHIIGFDTSFEARMPHGEGDFSRIGRVDGDVPRYAVDNTIRLSWGHFTLDEGVNVVIGQGWNTVHGLGAGAVAMYNPDTWASDLTPHWYSDARLIYKPGPRWGLGINARTSLGDNVVSDHFGVVLTRDWMR